MSSGLRAGAVFPQVETTTDAGAIDDYVAAIEDIGYDHLLAYDHVLGADVSTRPSWTGIYTSIHPFHEPFTLFAYLAARTSLGLATAVLVLPQRQTALVVKQAAQVDILSRGRLRLGVGIGWNEVEFHALGVDFARRVARMEAQIDLLRRLWTEPVLTHDGEFDVVDRGGIAPLPVQRPIPIWLAGGLHRKVLARVGRCADGYFPSWVPDRRVRGVDERGRRIGLDAAAAALDAVAEAAQAAGRSPTSIPVEVVINLRHFVDDESALGECVEDLRALGVTHAAVDTMGMGLSFPDEHIAVARRVHAVLGA